MTFAHRITIKDPTFSETDEDIIDYINVHRSAIMQLSIQKIASDLYISPNAVMRLSKKLGYSGFSELKFAIHNEGRTEEKTLSRQLLEHLPNNIVKTLDTIDEDAIRTAALLMHKAHCCIFAGVGDSTYFCEMLGKNLKCLECNVQYYQQIHDMVYAVEHAVREDLLVIISARGRHARLLSLAEKAGKKGIKVISLTHFQENPLSSISDISLHFWGEERNVGGYNVTDRSGLMVLVRLLSEEFWRVYGKKTE